MITPTPIKLKSLNETMYYELARVEAIISSKIVSDIGFVDIGDPPVSTSKAQLWTDNWNSLIASVEANLAIDRTAEYQKLIMSVSTASIQKLDPALLDAVNFNSLMGLNGIAPMLHGLADSAISYADLTPLTSLVDSAWAAEQAAINAFSTNVTNLLVTRAIGELVASPIVQPILELQGYLAGMPHLVHSIQIPQLKMI